MVFRDALPYWRGERFVCVVVVQYPRGYPVLQRQKVLGGQVQRPKSACQVHDDVVGFVKANDAHGNVNALEGA